MKRHGSMNHIFRLVWSQVLNLWVAVAEKTRGRGKGSSRKLSAAAIAAALAMPGLAAAAPLNGQLIAGNGSIAQAGAVTTITQLSPNLSLNWKSFNVAPQESVNFIQPSAASIAVNRIADTAGSQILGKLHANGQVFLINPNGILFGANAQVNVGGLVASTLDISDANLNSNSKTFSGNGSGSVINQGAITAANGGYVALLANHVGNSGVIQAQLGAIALGAGSAATLTFAGNSLVQMQVDQSVLNSLAENGGLLQADGGTVLMKAGARDSLLASVVNNTGVIQAHGVAEHDGMITLLAGMTAGATHVDGTLDASAAEGGKGGFIETSAAHVNVTDEATVTTAAAKGSSASAGTWLLDPADFVIAASGGNITGAAVTKALLTNNYTIYSTASKTNKNGDIDVNDVVSWSKNKLTLNAQHSIYIHADLNGKGTASLALEFGQWAQYVGTYLYYDYQSYDNFHLLGGRINLPAGQNFSTKFQGNDPLNYTVITSIDALQLAGKDLISMGSYALGADIEAKATSGWNNGLGFNPIASMGFESILDGLGHSINNLTINRPSSDAVGLIATSDHFAVIRNLGLVNANIIGRNNVGALVGTLSQGFVENSYATGNIKGNNTVGGLVGDLIGGRINASYVNANVMAIDNKVGSAIGGLVGRQEYDDGQINGDITIISNCYALGSVAGSMSIGGLVGFSKGYISDSYAANKITAASIPLSSGGLVGLGLDLADSGMTQSNSYWNTDISSKSTSPRGTGITTIQMKQAATFSGWDKTLWTFNSNSFPILTGLINKVTVTANSFSKTYDGLAYVGSTASLTAQANASYSGVVSYIGTAQNDKNAGTYTSTGSGLTANDQQTVITYVDGTLKVTPKTVDISSVGRTYDGTNKVQGSVFTVSNTVGKETLNLSGYALLLSGKVDGKVAADNSIVSYSTLALTNGTGLASNYTLNKTTPVVVKITPLALTIVANGDTKTYDGTLKATVKLSASGVLANDAGDVQYSNSLATFATKDVGAKKAIAVSGLALSGAAAQNYSIANANKSTTALADITKKIIILTISGADKVYDGTVNTSATLTSSGLVGDDVVLFTNTGGTFDNKNVGQKKTVTVSGVSATGKDKGNYNFGNLTSGTANITARPLYIDNTKVSDKTYDGNTSATLTNGVLRGAINGESLNFTLNQIGTFVTKDAGNAVGVTVSDTISGAGSTNYSLQQPLTLTGVINKKVLSVNSTQVASKTYDGNTSATLSGGVLAGLVGNEFIPLTQSGTFTTKSVGDAVGVTAQDSISGVGANNYLLTQPSNLTAAIKQKVITVNAQGANRAYDGTLNDTLTLSSADTVKTDDVKFSATGTFGDKNIGSNKPLVVSNVNMFGLDAANYRMSDGALSAAANIVQKEIVVSTIAANKTYDGTTTATARLSVSGLIAGEDVTFTPGIATFSDKNAAVGKTVTLSSITTLGNDIGNYAVITNPTTTADITQKNINPMIVSRTRVYDGTDIATNVVLVPIGVVGDEHLALGYQSSTYDKKDAGMRKLTVNDIILFSNNGDSNNYFLSGNSAATNVMINPKVLSFSAIGVDKTYDATTIASAKLLSGDTIAGDDVTFSPTSAIFSDKNVGSAKAVTISGITLAGNDQLNYTVAQSSAVLQASAAITPKKVMVIAYAANKIYDGTVSANVTLTSAGIISGDNVSFGDSSAAFTDADAGTEQTVTVSGIVANGNESGDDSANYDVSNPTATTSATITPAP